MNREFQEFESTGKCPTCGSETVETAFEPDIGRCANCRVYFRSPRPTQNEIARSYDTGETFTAWQREEPARAKMWERRATLVRRFRSGGKLLDIGTGDGRFLRAARTHGYQVTGTELSAEGASYARKDGFDIRLGQVMDIELPRENFDIITIWHVLEHVPNPGELLHRMHALLKPGGILIVAVPNEENYFVRRALHLPVRSSPFAPLVFGGEIHLTYFQPATLRTTLRIAEFELLEFGVDDLYSVRDTKMKLRLSLQRLLARVTQWHFAVAMYAVCQRKPAL